MSSISGKAAVDRCQSLEANVVENILDVCGFANRVKHLSFITKDFDSCR